MTVAKALLNHWISIFGAPVEIISDNGTSFKNPLKSHLFMLLGIKEVFSLPYYPQANGGVFWYKKTSDEINHERS